MPVSLAAAEKPTRSQRDPELSGKRRHRRSHVSLAEIGELSTEGRPFNASQPADSTVRSPSPERRPRPATQPELTDAEDHVPSRRSGQVVKVTLTHPHGEVPDKAALIEEFKARRRRSPGAPSPIRERNTLPADDSDVAGTAGDVPASQRKTSKKKKRKRKEVVRDVPQEEATLRQEDTEALPEEAGPEGAVTDISPAPLGFGRKSKGKDGQVVGDFIQEAVKVEPGPALSDTGNEHPSSTQPPRKRSRRESDSEARKKKKSSQKTSTRELDAEVKPEPPDEVSSLVEEAALERMDGGSRTAMRASTKRRPVASAQSLPADMEMDQGDEPERPGATWPAPNVPSEDQPAGTTSSSNLRRAADSPPPPSDSGYAEPDDQAQKEMEPGMDVDIADGLPRHGYDDIGIQYAASAYAPTTMSQLPSSNSARNTKGSVPESPTRQEADALPDQDGAAVTPVNQEANEHADEQLPVKENSQPTSTPGTVSAKSPGSRTNTKRKTKRPFTFPCEDEENAKAFSELPADVAAPPRSRPSKKAQVSVRGESGASAMPRNGRKRKTRKQQDGDRAETSEDGDNATAIRQYRSGPLSQTEQDAVVRAVERFRDNQAISQEEVIQLIHANLLQAQAASRQLCGHLWSSIQDACPSRPRQKLINWCRQRFHNFVARGTWTKEQDDELADLVDAHGKKWSFIAGLINRHQKDVRDRWRNYLICREKIKTDVWSEDEEERLRELVEQAMETIREKLPEHSRKSPEQLINWLAISEEMGHTRSRLQCMEKWKRMRAAEPIPDKAATVLPPGSSWRLEKARAELRKFSVNDKFTLVRAVRDSGVGTDKKINWAHIRRDVFGGKFERQTLIVTWGRLRQSVPESEWKTTRDCARYLCDMYEREGNLEAPGGAEAEEEGHGSPPPVPSPVSKKKKKKKKQDEGKGKEVVPASPAYVPTSEPQAARAKSRKRPTTAHSAIHDDDAGLVEPHPKRSEAKSSKKNRAATSTEHVATKDQATIESLNPATQPPAEEQPGPEPDFEQSQLSPSVKAQVSRTKRRERRASVAEQSSVGVGEGDFLLPGPKAANTKTPKRSHGSFSHGDAEGPETAVSGVDDPSAEGKEDEEAGPPSSAPPRTASARVSKKSRHGSLSNSTAESPRLKKRKLSGFLSAKTAKVNRSAKAAMSGEAEGRPSASGKSWSDISSDMDDDMEDIPATLPSSWRSRN
ncbi:uncharacterized protein B0T15DRAFT_493997 [Chaetomium strumarium]|uniref:Uncharacterized protein n=1 Tax=Chaetomium strumarium TaxID=1170767 RepID=A0AAJ0GTG6_9PEZI|nr:hypothetical protein B0T15DRAFT_493997 [Chaetomium strumarium]